MASIDDNRAHWSSYDWSDRGDEWSQLWGGTSNLWHGVMMPRLGSFVPARHILEIAPGYGRMTRYLKNQCERLTLVDVTESCIEACRSRFALEGHLSYLVNDGCSLSDVDDNSVDFVFSYDSLVHADETAVRGYVTELDRVLTARGTAFLHHSNLGEFKRGDGSLAVENRHWRADSVSARAVEDWARQGSDLVCFAQEVINWGGGPELTDCFSAFCRRSDERAARPFRRQENPDFIAQGLALASTSSLFDPSLPNR